MSCHNILISLPESRASYTNSWVGQFGPGGHADTVGRALQASAAVRLATAPVTMAMMVATMPSTRNFTICGDWLTP
jgi:hypothetical protein